jgi:hypothetical protein
MDSLARRLDRIEKQWEPEKGPWLRWPNDDGTFTEVPGCLLVSSRVRCSCPTHFKRQSPPSTMTFRLWLITRSVCSDMFCT